MRHVDAALVHECRQARGLSLSLSIVLGPLDRARSEMVSHENRTSEGEELARECAAIAMLPSPPRAQEC